MGSVSTFPVPSEEVTTRVKTLDLFYDSVDNSLNMEQIFNNLPLSLRHLGLSYTDRARNMLEGWWQSLSTHSQNMLERIELTNFDENGLNDIITMFETIEFYNLQEFIFISDDETP